MEIKENTHIVIKREDALRYLEEPEYQTLEELQHKIIRGRARDHKQPRNKYYICNTDEPYAEMVKDVIINGEYGHNKTIEITKDIGKEGDWIPCSSGLMPMECEEVNVTIKDDEGDVYTTTSWLQEGAWVVKKTALHPRVIAWKPKDAPYQKGE